MNFVTDELRDDWDVIYQAVLLNGENLRYASNRLKDDRRIVLKAVEQNG